MKDKDGKELVAGRWYNFGGDVEWRFTGTKRISYSARTADGRVHKPAGPASRDAIEAALYYGLPSMGYGDFIGGKFPPDQKGTMH